MLTVIFNDVITRIGEPVKVTANGHIIHPCQITDIGKVVLNFLDRNRLLFISVS